jgi:hypothetical protein
MAFVEVMGSKKAQQREHNANIDRKIYLKVLRVFIRERKETERVLGCLS